MQADPVKGFCQKYLQTV